MMEKKKDIIEVLHEKDLPTLLGEYGKIKDFNNQKINCKFCDDTITLENIYGVYINRDNLEFLCNKDLCYNKSLLIKEGDEDF